MEIIISKWRDLWFTFTSTWVLVIMADLFLIYINVVVLRFDRITQNVQIAMYYVVWKISNTHYSTINNYFLLYILNIRILIKLNFKFL